MSDEFRFLAGSITVIVANFVLDKWARARVVNGVDRAVAFGGFLFILVSTVYSGVKLFL